jgi:hypothetical protein
VAGASRAAWPVRVGPRGRCESGLPPPRIGPVAAADRPCRRCESFPAAGASGPSPPRIGPRAAASRPCRRRESFFAEEQIGRWRVAASSRARIWLAKTRSQGPEGPLEPGCHARKRQQVRHRGPGAAVQGRTRAHLSFPKEQCADSRLATAGELAGRLGPAARTRVRAAGRLRGWARRRGPRARTRFRAGELEGAWARRRGRARASGRLREGWARRGGRASGVGPSEGRLGPAARTRFGRRAA